MVLYDQLPPITLSNQPQQGLYSQTHTYTRESVAAIQKTQAPQNQQIMRLLPIINAKLSITYLKLNDSTQRSSTQWTKVHPYQEQKLITHVLHTTLMKPDSRETNGLARAKPLIHTYTTYTHNTFALLKIPTTIFA